MTGGGETITGREKERKPKREETTELNKLEKHLSGQLMLLSRPLIPPSPDFRRQIKALVPPGTVNTFSTPPREIMRACVRACTYERRENTRERAHPPSEGERRAEWRKNGTLLVFANDVPPSRRRATFPRFWNDLSAPRQRRFVSLKWRYSREIIRTCRMRLQ